MSKHVFFAAVSLALAVTSLSSLARASADLVVDKSEKRDPVRVGKRLTYIVTVRNEGDEVALNVAFTDTTDFFRGVRFVRAQTSQGECADTDAEGTIVCDLGDIDVGDTVTVKIVVIPTQTGDINNTAFASADNEEDFSDNQDSIVTTVVSKN